MQGMNCSLVVGQSYLPVGPTSQEGVPRYLSDVKAALLARPAEAPDITLAAAHHLVHELAYEADERLSALSSLIVLSSTTRDKQLHA